MKQEVRAVWQESLDLISNQKKESEQNLNTLEKTKERLFGLVVDGTIDGTTYKEQLAKLEDQITVAQVEHSESLAEGYDVEAVLAFTDTILGDARKMWLNNSLEFRQKFQGLIFPEGVIWNGDELEPPVIHWFVKHLTVENAPLVQSGGG